MAQLDHSDGASKFVYERSESLKPRTASAQHDNTEDDIRRLGEIHKLVSGYAGHDTFSVIVPRGSARVQIDFPNDKTKCNKLLIKQLEQRLGSHSVRVVNKTPPDAREKWRKQAGT